MSVRAPGANCAIQPTLPRPPPVHPPVHPPTPPPSILPYLRLHLPHRAVLTTHDVRAGAGRELRHPADAAHEETRVDVEDDQGRVAVRVPPVDDEGQLKARGQRR